MTCPAGVANLIEEISVDRRRAMTYATFTKRSFVYRSCPCAPLFPHGAIHMRDEQGHIACLTRDSIDWLQTLVHRNLHQQSRDAWTHGTELRPSMETLSGPDVPTEDFQLRFQSLFTGGEAFVIPCNAG